MKFSAHVIKLWKMQTNFYITEITVQSVKENLFVNYFLKD